MPDHKIIEKIIKHQEGERRTIYLRFFVVIEEKEIMLTGDGKG